MQSHDKSRLVYFNGCVSICVDRHGDIHFREMHLHAKGGESGDVGIDTRDVWRQIEDVHLQADSVDGHASLSEVFHHGIEGIGFRIYGFRSAVVIEQ
jgi:hypothetical protein